MLPVDPPHLSSKDFDPSTLGVGADDEDDDGGERTTHVELSSVEINILIYLVRILSVLTKSSAFFAFFVCEERQRKISNECV